jgi:Domain of unknown function (DUF4331)
MKCSSTGTRAALFLLGAALLTHSPGAFAASHREAPITALDQKADITDWYAFVSPEYNDRVVMILNVDPLLEPSNGPNYFPFDPRILYEMHVDNNFDAEDDITFQFRFQTQIRQPGVFTGFVGGLLGIPPITALDGAGSEGLSLRQSYTVTVIKGKGPPQQLTGGRPLFAVPTNVGPRTMPDYASLRQQGIYDLGNGFRVFAGTVADPFFIDLGAAFDSLNFRKGAGGGILSSMVDADDQHNYAPNALTGFNVNSIVLEVPKWFLLQGGHRYPASSKFAVIGTYGSTSRARMQIRAKEDMNSSNSHVKFAQVQRMGNALINELIIGTGFKDRFSMDDPENDGQFANFFLDPLLARIFASIGIPVQNAPRKDLLPLVQYMAPLCPGCGPKDAGPVADLLRLNTGIPPTPVSQQKRLGFLAGDLDGYPDGRRLSDDVVDISARAVAGILADPTKFNTLIGDGVNKPKLPASGTFPFEAPAYSGRDSVHEGPGQTGCDTLPNMTCPVD